MKQADSLKISFGMIVVNGEPFIRYNLENLYPHAHEILIVEGAVEKFYHAATTDGHSIDNTVEIIKNFPDPECKIKLIQREGFWPEKDAMANAYMNICTGDYIWQVDVDEFYKPDDVEKVRMLLASDPEISRVDIKTINFWRGFSAVLQGATYIYGADDFIRIFRYRPNYSYETHRPPTLMDECGHTFNHKRIISAKELITLCEVYIYHYSYVFPEYVRYKADYYSRMGWGGGHEDGIEWYSKEWIDFSNPLRVHIIKFPPSWIVPFQGDHPKIIKKMKQDLNFMESQGILQFLKNEFRRYKKVGENLSLLIIMQKNSKQSRYKLFFRALQQLWFPRSFHAIHANYTVLNTAKTLITK